MLDQPTQAYYPSEMEQVKGLPEGEDDRAAVHQLFELMRDVTVELGAAWQLIVCDHANLPEDWFQAAVGENNWRGGLKLIPQEWIEEAEAETVRTNRPAAHPAEPQRGERRSADAAGRSGRNATTLRRAARRRLAPAPGEGLRLPLQQSPDQCDAQHGCVNHRSGLLAFDRGAVLQLVRQVDAVQRQRTHLLVACASRLGANHRRQAMPDTLTSSRGLGGRRVTVLVVGEVRERDEHLAALDRDAPVLLRSRGERKVRADLPERRVDRGPSLKLPFVHRVIQLAVRDAVQRA